MARFQSTIRDENGKTKFNESCNVETLILTLMESSSNALIRYLVMSCSQEPTETVKARFAYRLGSTITEAYSKT